MKQKYAFNCLKTILVLLITISSTNNLNSQTVLTEGDIAFTRINMDDESFSFVFLVPIANTTQFIITDETWNSSNALGNSESKIRFTATSSFLAGEEISISSATLSFASTGSGTATLTSIGAIDPALGNMLGSAGDNLFIYQPEGTPSVNDFVAGINANSGVSGTPGNAWQIVSTSSTSSSGLPSGLTNGTNALGIYPFGGAQSEVDNARYKSTALRSGDKATVLAAIMNLSNWEYHNSVVQAPVGTSFTITGGNAAPTASNFTATPSQNSVHTFATADFSYSDGDSDPIAHLRITAIPGNGTLYVDANANDAYDSGEQLANGSAVSKANLDAGNLQYYNTDGTSSSFTFDVNDGTEYSASTYTTTLTVTATGATEPTSAASSITFSSITETGMTVGWTNGNGARRIVVAKSGSAVSADPVDGTTGYSANATFGSGTDLGSNNYIIYDGTGTSVAVTGLSTATTYHYKVIEVNGSGATANYYLTGAPTSNQASQNAPVTITSIVRQTPTDATTDADQVVFRVTFDKGVENVDITDFALSGTSAADGTVSTVTPVSVSIYDVTVTGLTNSNGTINLDIKGNDGVSGSNNIAELAGAALSQTTTGNTIAQPEIGQSFTAAATGDFTDVTFYMNIAATYSGAGTLELRSGEGLTGTVLATETVNFVDQGTAYQQKFTFSTPATVTLGNVYTIRISGAFGNSLTFDAKTGDPFAGGMIYIPSPLASADLTFEATISTGVGALLSTVAPTTDETYTISNNVAPTVTSVTVPANATYLVDQNLDFIINFDENVTVNTGGGTPQMSLTIGATTRQATYQSGTGTSGLLFRYTIQNGDLDTDGVVVGTLAANGGTIQDADNADATLTLNSIGATTAVLVDATATTATLTTVDASSVDSVSAALGGDVTTDGGDTVTERGIVYAITSTNNNPTIGDTGVTKNDNGSGIGTFSESITGLTANTQYSYVAYAINSQGTSYGTVKTFITSALGVETDFLQKSISVYPNPVADALYIDVNNAIEVENVKLYDVSGKLLKTPMLINKKIDFSDINNGLYFIKINTKQGALTKLIVKK
ncbi:T9SS type A sorting domain-containing protein [Wocania ichthyoenteri]|uniref:T9SS type A sorting domain-containing protein n=1 Tax=Wocania ichthyoenteri TaxID=1230531 RepID=UPI00053F1644|nr:T9SS type A sorting domain-containing protein [Wocania ichthyoenteri]